MKIAVLSQVVNGVVLPFVLIFMLLLINKKELMGEYVNTRLFNVVAWATTVSSMGLSLMWAYASMKGWESTRASSARRVPHVSRLLRDVGVFAPSFRASGLFAPR